MFHQKSDLLGSSARGWKKLFSACEPVRTAAAHRAIMRDPWPSAFTCGIFCQAVTGASSSACSREQVRNSFDCVQLSIFAARGKDDVRFEARRKQRSTSAMIRYVLCLFIGYDEHW